MTSSERYRRRAEDVGTRDYGGMTHEEIGRQLGLSRGRVWQIEREAMRKIRRNVERLEAMRRRQG